MIQDGQAEEVLAVAMSSAHGEFFPDLPHERRFYLRRCANAALLRLGADAQADGGATLREVVEGLVGALDSLGLDPAFNRLSEDTRETMAQLSVRLRFVAGAVADTKEPPTVIPAAAPEVDDEEEGV